MHAPAVYHGVNILRFMIENRGFHLHPLTCTCDRYGVTGDRYGVTQSHPRCDLCYTLVMMTTWSFAVAHHCSPANMCG
jgi:hypothetical protein